MWDKKTLEFAIKNSESKAGVLQYLGFNTSGGNYNKLKREIIKHNLDTSHFISRSEFCKRLNPSQGRKYLFEDIFKLNNKKIMSNTHIKNILIKENIKKDSCECCGLKNEWNGKLINLQLDHIDGNSLNNNIYNLRIICPNCHSQTNTFSGRNRGNSLNKRKKIEKQIKEKIEFDNVENILKSNIDFSKGKWGVKVAKLLNKSPQWSLKLVKQNYPHLLTQNKMYL
jgi:Zn finger protein HypA/HybF involved in hydrogenase expression